ncbi:MAG: hypothetical protein GOMPHAMPRED_005418 [Gomphillus americanus]|uniref:Uncharacterized protein n=1 Tax=Gomphillus americanus TaxID=1940652 RepID=A0A8H3FXX1_9LECA|nr:MAG: hypothetical protein GOMPHAMPRED_005418 [Gomphillus americanus]
MLIARSIARSTTSRSSSLHISRLRLRRTYADAPKPEQSSSRLPWIVLGLGLAGAGAYFTLLPAENKQQAKEQINTIKEHVKGNPEAHKQEREFEASRKPKPNPDKSSEEGHAKACETNEHKVRHGVFSAGKDFDNHDSRHSMDPSKDFEAVKK